MTKRQAPELAPSGWVRRIIRQHLVEVMLVGFIVFRLLYIRADPSGPYMNTDEGHHNADARGIVLYGTPFYDTYNPSVLMPFFTLFKVPFLALFGANHVGLRLPSVLCVMFGTYLFCRILQRRGESLAAHLVMFYVGISYFYFSHSRLGIHEPVLMFFSALSLFLLYYAFETGKTSYYIGSFACATSVPLIKTSGVFIFGTVAICLLWKVIFDRKSVNLRAVATGVGLTLVTLALVAAFWMYPHRKDFWDLYTYEVAGKQTKDLLASTERLAVLTWTLAPLLCVMTVFSAVAFFNTALTAPRRCDNLELILFAWLVCGCAPLAYSEIWFWRWWMWIIFPLTVLGLRAFARIVGTFPDDPSWPRQARATLTGAFVIAIACGNFIQYREYYRTISFSMYNSARRLEQVVGTNMVAGSGLGDAVYSPRINLYFDALRGKEPHTCADLRETFPSEEKTPHIFGWHIHNDPARFNDIIRAWYAMCPEWKAQYQPYALYWRIDYNRAWDIWFVRANKTPERIPLVDPLDPSETPTKFVPIRVVGGVPLLDLSGRPSTAQTQ